MASANMLDRKVHFSVHCSDPGFKTSKRWMLTLAIFLDWRKRNGQEKVIHALLSDTGQEITEASQIIRHFFKFYQTQLSTDIIKDQRDTGLLNKIMMNFNLTSAARINWDKSKALAVGNWKSGLTVLRQDLQ